MWTAAIVKIEISTDRMSRLADGFVGSQIDLLVFDAFPQPLNEHVVPPSSFAVHADGDAVVGEHGGEGRAGELRALAGVDRSRLRARTHRRAISAFGRDADAGWRRG